MLTSFFLLCLFLYLVVKDNVSVYQREWTTIKQTLSRSEIQSQNCKMYHVKLWPNKMINFIVWVMAIALISRTNALTLASPVAATATVNPIFQLNSTGNLS